MESLVRYDIIGIAIALIIIIGSLITTIWKMWSDHSRLTGRVVDVVEQNGKKSEELSGSIKANTKATERLESMIDRTLRESRFK